METNNMKISAVLITRAKEYPKIIMDRLQLGFFDEVLIGTESPSVYARYQLAEKARNEIIYVQDDDCLMNYQNLFTHYNNSITNAMPLPFKQQYDNMGCTLVGWGCYFPKNMISSFDKYIAKYGKDQHLLREADRIFTYLNKPFNTIIMPHEDLPRASSAEAMYADPNHFPSAHEALKKTALL